MHRRLFLVVIYVALNSNTWAFDFDGTSLPSSFHSSDFPNYFQSVKASIHVPEPIVPGVTPFIQSRAGLVGLAHDTNTDSECYLPEKAPVNLTDLTPIMGTWYETHKFNNNESQQHLCEQVTYTQKNATYFYKNAIVTMPFTAMGQTFYSYIAISGYGTLIHPGVVNIHWQDLITGEPDSLVYMILGTDYTNYLVGYTCENSAKKPEIVFNTRKRNPTRDDINTAKGIVESLKLPLNWVGCVANPL